MTTTNTLIQRGTRAAQPSTQLSRGTLYFVTDEGVTERWNGSAWQSFSGSASAGGPPVKYEIDTGSTADSDPGAGILKFNHATQSSATEIYIDNADYNAVTMTTLFASLSQTGFLTLTQSNDSTKWRLYKITAVTAMSGYYKLTVVHQAGLSSFADAATVYASFDTQGSGGASVVVQVKNTQTGAVNTGATVFPIDDTIPQNNEGVEFMSLAITPTSATNKLRIDVTLYGSHSAGSSALIAALFQDSTANALAAGYASYVETAGGTVMISLTHYMTAGTTSATTFKVRAGSNVAGTFTFNGNAGTRQFGGVMASGITITEIIP